MNELAEVFPASYWINLLSGVLVVSALGAVLILLSGPSKHSEWWWPPSLLIAGLAVMLLHLI